MRYVIEITHEEVNPIIMALFDISKPTMPRAFNVLEGITRGQILLDALTNPPWACVRETTYGSLYLGGNVNARVVEALVEKFHQTGEVGIGCWLDSELNDMLPSNPDYDGRTLYFTECSLNRELLSLEPPNGYALNWRDSILFRQSSDYDVTLASFGSIENVMAQTLGVVILYEGKVICEAATGASTHGLIEVGVTTHEAHRQRGLATVACAHLIQACESKGYKTWWDCAKQNTPSVKLARKLGYRNEQEYRYVWWKKE